MKVKLISGCIVALAASLTLAATPAFADTLFANPVGDIGTGDCSSAVNACDLQQAVETEAGAGDEVILAPGDYMEGPNELDLTVAATVHGAVGQARPRIVTTSNIGVRLNAGILRRVEIEHTSGGGGIGLWLLPGTAEQVVVHTTDGSQACMIQADPSSIRDSICRSTRPAGSAALRVQSSGAGNLSPTIRNVTAVATDPLNGVGLGVEAIAPATATVTATNLIADGPAADVQAFSDAANAATVTLDHSNYATQAEVGAGAAVTDPGTGTGNQIGAPMFLSAGTGDFHQVLGSPTIDAGIGGAGLGTADIDGEARTQGSLPDIGADEFVPPVEPPAGDQQPVAQTPAPKKCKKGQKLKKGKCAKKKRKKKRR